MDKEPLGLIDFNNTEIAFSYKSDKELKEINRLFTLMNSPRLVSLMSSVLPLALKLHIPFVKYGVKKTIFKHFVGGQNILDTQRVIDLLYRHNTLTILDYGAESKSSEEELDNVMNENINAIELAASNSSVPVISTKLTGVADNDLLIDVQSGKELSVGQIKDLEKVKFRIDKICKRAYDLDVGVMIDAEESWLQDTLNDMVDEMMATYNHNKIIVYNTFQLYRNDQLDFLKESFEKANAGNYKLGAKLVRGAYMEKERDYAEKQGIKCVIHVDKESTDADYNAAIKFCVDNYQVLASVCATHNIKSNLYQAQLISENNIEKDHPHLNFCQLLGMSDNITFNLAKEGFNVAKYVPYGPIKEVIPYLIRRAQENSSVTGDLSRELKLVQTEIKRRGL